MSWATAPELTWAPRLDTNTRPIRPFVDRHRPNDQRNCCKGRAPVQIHRSRRRDRYRFLMFSSLRLEGPRRYLAQSLFPSHFYRRSTGDMRKSVLRYLPATGSWDLVCSHRGRMHFAPVERSRYKVQDSLVPVLPPFLQKSNAKTLQWH
jgi:hypothetical protein